MEEGVPDLTQEDFNVITYFAAKVGALLIQQKKEIANPKESAKKMLKFYSHEDNVIATFIGSSLNKLDPEKLYKPEDFREIVATQVQQNEVDEDIQEIV